VKIDPKVSTKFEVNPSTNDWEIQNFQTVMLERKRKCQSGRILVEAESEAPENMLLLLSLYFKVAVQILSDPC
jgi:hypothetical protein